MKLFFFVFSSNNKLRREWYKSTCTRVSVSLAKKDGAQDIYLFPRIRFYELHMQIGDERRLINSYDFEKLGAVISHFKFIAGMNVGESVVVSLGPVIISMMAGYFTTLSTVKIVVVSLVILAAMKVKLRFWFQDLRNWKNFRQRGLYLGPVGKLP